MAGYNLGLSLGPPQSIGRWYTTLGMASGCALAWSGSLDWMDSQRNAGVWQTVSRLIESQNWQLSACFVEEQSKTNHDKVVGNGAR